MRRGPGTLSGAEGVAGTARPANAAPSPATLLERTSVLVLATALVLAGAVVTSGCARQTATPVAPSGSVSDSASDTSAPPTSARKPAKLADVKIELKPLVRGLQAPLFVTHAGDGSGRLFVVEQGGRVLVVENGAAAKEPYLDVSDRISSGGERGLLGLAFAPRFSENGRFYVNYTDKNGDTNVVRFTASDPASNNPKLNGPELVLKVAQPYANHNGGCLMFGPDGYLYIGMGDGGSGGDPQNNAQNPKRLLGKMLRIDVEGGAPSAGRRYAIPSDNPYANGQDGAPEVWMIGLRNPWRCSFDRKTEAMWIGDVGQDTIEEIDVAEPGVGGQNWGWNLMEGTGPYNATGGHRPSSLKQPVAQYTHKQGESITGGYVYRGRRFPDLDGLYLYADFVDGWVAGMRSEDATVAAPGTALTRKLLENVGNPSSFGEDEAGELYLVDLNGTVSQIVSAR